ncbi:MAG: SAVED domain-containing protein [Microcystis aeruginosa G11-06]|nr:SAVED domain-containing protein [Microcystis aeruginosa G11-06]
MLTSLQNVLSNLRQSPYNIFFNPLTNTGLAIAAILALIADQFGQGYYLIFLITLALVIIGIWRESQKYDLYKHQAIPLPIVIKIANPADSNKALQSLFNIIETENKYKDHKNNLDKYLNISETDLIFNYSCDIYISVAIMVGTILATEGVKIFQYNKSSDSYYPVVEISDRKLKEGIKEYEKFEDPVTEKGQDRVTIAIDVSSHKINLNDESIENYGDLIYLKSKGSGTIERNEDWLQYSREIFTTINSTQQNNYQEIKLVYSIPITLGILVGMSVQQYWPILLTQYENSTYRNLINLQEFKLYRGQ